MLNLADLLDGGPGDDPKRKKASNPSPLHLRASAEAGRQAFAELGLDPGGVMLGILGIPEAKAAEAAAAIPAAESFVGGLGAKLRRMLPQSIQEILVENTEDAALKEMIKNGLQETDFTGPTESDLASEIDKVARFGTKKREIAAGVADELARGDRRELAAKWYRSVGMRPPWEPLEGAAGAAPAGPAEAMYPGPDGIPIPGLDDILGAEYDYRKMAKSPLYKLADWASREGLTGKPNGPAQAMDLLVNKQFVQSAYGAAAKTMRDVTTANPKLKSAADQAALAVKDPFSYFSQAFQPDSK